MIRAELKKRDFCAVAFFVGLIGFPFLWRYSIFLAYVSLLAGVCSFYVACWFYLKAKKQDTRWVILLLLLPFWAALVYWLFFEDLSKESDNMEFDPI
jgi:drug/metabolite transporter (DMT)-like permease